MTCATCAAKLAPSLLACPACQGLIHAERLKHLAADAGRAESEGDVSTALAAWREALTLLPSSSTQYAHVHDRLETLSRTAVGITTAAPATTWWKTGGVIGAALLAWKFKAVVGFVLTKGKLLALGLTNSGTVLTMLPSLGVYWVAFGWQFAAGLIASIYVHEMGHVAALAHFGIPASPPMFLPGVGAVVRSRQVVTNVHEDARVGLAGPIWGLAAAVAALGLQALSGSAIWGAIGQVGAWINLFNLAPVWQLDGNHAFKAMHRTQRWLVVATALTLLVWTRQGLLVLIAALGAMRAWADDGPAAGDATITAQFVGLVAILAYLAQLPALPA